MQDHRGILILALGILSLLICPPLGIAPWLIGNGDLRAMDAGTMDPEGRGLTQVGKILGIVSIAIFAIGLVVGVLAVLFFGMFAAGAPVSTH
jgi:hypothetical protein